MSSVQNPEPTQAESARTRQPERPRPVVAVGGSQQTSQQTPETRGAKFGRKARRTGLYVYAGLAVILLVALVALVIANTRQVEVSWVVGSASVSLVWMLIFSAILGLLLGMVLGALFRWRTRAPRS